MKEVILNVHIVIDLIFGKFCLVSTSLEKIARKDSNVISVKKYFPKYTIGMCTLNITPRNIE